MDKTILLKNPVTGKTEMGYYGFSNESLYSLGLVWLRRGDIWSFLTFVCTWIPLFWVKFGVSDDALIDKIFGGARTVLGIPSMTLVYVFIVLFMIAFHIIACANCNKKHTLPIINRGFALDKDAPNYLEAHKELGLL